MKKGIITQPAFVYSSCKWRWLCKLLWTSAGKEKKSGIHLIQDRSKIPGIQRDVRFTPYLDKFSYFYLIIIIIFFSSCVFLTEIHKEPGSPLAQNTLQDNRCGQRNCWCSWALLLEITMHLLELERYCFHSLFSWLKHRAPLSSPSEQVWSIYLNSNTQVRKLSLPINHIIMSEQFSHQFWKGRTINMLADYGFWMHDYLWWLEKKEKCKPSFMSSSAVNCHSR